MTSSSIDQFLMTSSDKKSEVQSFMNSIFTGLDFLNQNQGYQPMEFRQDLFDNTMSNLMPGMQAQFDSGARDLTRGFTWNTLPGLNMEAAMAGVEGGNTKLGQQTALGQARTQENIADYGMGLYTNALNQAQSAGMAGGQTDAGNFLRGVGQTLQGYGQFGNMGNNLLTKIAMGMASVHQKASSWTMT